MPKLFYQGHSSFRITTNEGQVIFIDPFAGVGYETPADLVLITHVVYVWLDALTNYITALGYLQPDDSKFKKYWQDPDCEIVHVIGADITRFHTIYWPMFLEAMGLREPSRVFVHVRQSRPQKGDHQRAAAQ